MFNAGIIRGGYIPAPTGITLVGATANYAVTTGNFTCAMPSGVQSGDLLICVLAAPQLSDQNMVCNTAGYTEVYDEYTEANDAFFGVNVGIYTKVVSGTPDANVSVKGITSQAENHVQLLAFRGVNATTPVQGFIGSLTRVNQSSGLVANNGAAHPANSVMLMITAPSSFYGSGSVDGAHTIPAPATLIHSRQSNHSGRVGGLTTAYWLREASGSFNASIEGIGPFGGVYNSGTSRSSRAATLGIVPA